MIPYILPVNLIEQLREKAVTNLFSMNSFNNSFVHWKKEINNELGINPDYFKILNLGDSLGSIFKTTASAGRSQSSLSGGGAAWEGLVCWYLNLCLVGSRSVVIKHNKKLIPQCVSDSITVNYNNFTSNTESDLVVITFPDKPEFLKNNAQNISSKKHSELVSSLCVKYFSDLQVGIIQCKTNWNDNAQIPMLWDFVYSSTGFSKNISLGQNGFKLKDLQDFFYAFVTVPSNERVPYKGNSLSVKRVYSLSGGNYWGKPSQSGVAHSIKEIFNRNLPDSCCLRSQREDVEFSLQNTQDLSYFDLFW